ncbi:hypothetical protein [uncultured Bacteroides sp.]|uniref:hypothetical protein n=1 Tax=uncultured Bacteroides sp. TaxID=162156 RepID=UPI00261E2B1D|nr:hypothetical protein [uncultured Bacteroides sp.]
MKGLFPTSFRILGYALLVLSVFVPMLMYMFGMVQTDSSLILVKLGSKSVIWISLFFIFFAKADDEDEVTYSLRVKAIKFALIVLGIYYLVALAIAAVELNYQRADNSICIFYMVMNVICFEFLQQKRKIEKRFNRKS